jgi:hypothetical protein
VEFESGQEWYEQEESRGARMEGTTGREVQFATIGDFGQFGPQSVLARR